MSSIVRMAVGDKVPDDPAANAAMHQGLLDILNGEAGRVGWRGISFDLYTSAKGWAAITVVAGEAPATLEDLRSFREWQKGRLEAESDNHTDQGRLI
ncbi:hypothetical protein [Sinorhizobium fredii]|uniref:hypothetical protein n=1 Tax=Rhizobium fredii TaxID=380 RepID=UPI00056A65A3|nr:hypothetical protein [Sinorhizobium fredii]ASY69365.1 hypothetical protein SF83666_c19490 [Sinorhizobium fredii CCBAU 83666]